MLILSEYYNQLDIKYLPIVCLQISIFVACPGIIPSLFWMVCLMLVILSLLSTSNVIVLPVNVLIRQPKTKQTNIEIQKNKVKILHRTTVSKVTKILLMQNITFIYIVPPRNLNTKSNVDSFFML